MHFQLILIAIISTISIVLNTCILMWLIRTKERKAHIKTWIDDASNLLKTLSHEQENRLITSIQNVQQMLTTTIGKQQTGIQESLAKQVFEQMRDVRSQIQQSFTHHAGMLSQSVQHLNEEVKTHLNQMNKVVDQKLGEGFQQTNITFTNIIKRLTMIDEAQKKITELSSNVVSLQDLLSDKQARGAFGEIQLNGLISNVLPKANYAFQYTLSNQKRADCILFLPEPTGNLIIDAKFPLEDYKSLQNCSPNSLDYNRFKSQYKQILKKHINDIASKYIIPNETAEGALMFIPAESIFSDIHTNFPDIIAHSFKQKVWLASPSTLMAIITTAKAVLKDDATKKQVHQIQLHLSALAKDFGRFDKRMQNLSKHITLAQNDVTEVSTSAKKITARFNKIESLELESTDLNTSLLED